MKTNRINQLVRLASVILMTGFALPYSASAHCDTMDGPVVIAAKAALETKDVTPVLKWVRKGDEAQIKAAFAKTLTVRTQGPAARELADQFFFETLVRVHRAGEGAPYTGLKPAGTELSPALEQADKALADGSVEKLVKLLTSEVAAGVRRRFSETTAKKTHADHSVEAGRAFVAAYVEYVHYVEGLHQAIQGPAAHHEADSAVENPAHRNEAQEHHH